MKVSRLTIDANCVINLLDASSATATSVDELRTLVRYALEGKVEIAITTRLEADLLRYRDEARRRALLDSLNMFSVISTVARWDVTKWDTDLLADCRTARLNEEIQPSISSTTTTTSSPTSNWPRGRAACI